MSKKKNTVFTERNIPGDGWQVIIVNGVSFTPDEIAKAVKDLAAKKKLKDSWGEEKIKEARKDLRGLYEPSGMTYQDGYYARSLVQKWGMSLSELQEIVGTPIVKTTVEWK